jgi:hypothetical protein
LRKQTRKKLAGLKTHPRESYDELVNHLMSLIPEGDDEGKYTEEFRAGLLRAELDVRAGRVLSHEEVKKRLGL